MIKTFFLEIFLIFNFIISIFPRNSGKLLRKLICKIRFKKLGKNFLSDIFFSYTFPKNISIGNNCSLMKNCSLVACKNSKIIIKNNISVNRNVSINSANGTYIKIGNDVLIGDNVLIRAASHNYDNKNKKIRYQGHKVGKIFIGDNVWIGANSVILPNVIIQDGAVIGAGTIVSRNVYKHEIVVSSKQKVLKKY